MKRLLFLHIILLFGVLAWAQNGTSVATEFPYECSFEESENLSSWMLNYGTPTATDKWIFGPAVHSDGRRSMYVSRDGLNSNYGRTKNIVVSYLRYQFPNVPNQRHYEASFDWRGAGDSTYSKLYVMLAPENSFLNNTAANNYYDVNKIISTTSGSLSNYVIQRCQALGESGEKFVCGSSTWQNVTFTRQISIPSNSTQTYVFVFIWENSNNKDSLNTTSIAVDNFQITTADITTPQNVVVYPQCADSTLLVTWENEGTASDCEYDIQYRKVGETGWTHGISGISDGVDGFVHEEGTTKYSFTLKKILEGSYDVRIRGRYHDPEEGEFATRYVYAANILVYCPENHCINYVDLYSPNVLCTTGMNPDYYSSSGQTPYDVPGVVDFGPDNIESRHTLHVDPMEVDPRTDSLLHTVPDGALASVRLGNWDWGGEAESITYDILVDSTNQGILIVKYAVVLENPGSSHSKIEEPRFELEILDQNGDLIDTDCGHAVFSYSDGADGGWQHTEGDKAVWKDWTTVGVNLMPYDGQHIKVRFTTYDCSQGGHYAYAYFTVDCANGHIETENCGSDAQITCVAPEGFAYYWYKNDNLKDSVSDERTLIVAATEAKYTCRVSFIEQPDCYFEISTISSPRFPVPEYTYEKLFGDCQSKLQFTNTSHVMTVGNDGSENHTSELCNESRWTFRSLVTGRTSTMSSWNPTYLCLNKGDTVEVTIRSFIGAENACDSVRVDTIIMPNIISEPTEFHYTSCSESPIKFNDQWFDKDTTYVGHFKNFAGCDSLSTLFLKVYPKPQDLYIHDSICSDQSLTIAGVKYTRPLDNYLIMLKNANGCDSAIYLTLTVNERLKATVDSVPYSCLDEGQMYIWMDIAAGVYDSLVIRFNTPYLRDTTIYDQVTSVAIPYTENLLPGHYSATLTFHQFCCGIYSETRGFDIRYPSSIVDQKWNDVLTLLSPKYNGGYEFLSFQWYKDNVPMIGETHSYLYQPLDFNSEYYVELMRKDSVIMKTCPIQPVYHEQQTAYPTIVQAGQHMPMYMDHPVTIWYYTAAGQLYSTFDLPQGYTSLPTPGQPGVFVIKSVNSEGETKAQVMIVE